LRKPLSPKNKEVNLMGQLPDPKTLVDSVADGAVEMAEGPARIATNVANVAGTFASEVKSNMDNVKGKMPEDPTVIPEAAVKAAGQAVKAGLGMVEAIGQGAMDTFDSVKKQIQRVTG